MSTWGTRECLVCQKKFEAQYPAHIVCSSACLEKRKRELKKESNKKYRERAKAMLAECVAGRAAIAALQEEIALLARERDNYEGARSIGKQQNDSLLARIEELEKENARLSSVIKKKDAEIRKLYGVLKKQAPVNAKGSAPISDAEKEGAIQEFINKIALQKCERLKLSATKLPCGKKPQCWNEPVCDKCKDKKKPEKMYLYSGRLSGQIHEEIENEF